MPTYPVRDLDGFEDFCERQIVPSDCVLFRYCPPERVTVLENETVVLSPPMAFNDPFEMCPAFPFESMQRIQQRVRELARLYPFDPRLSRKERKSLMRRMVIDCARDVRSKLPKATEEFKNKVQRDFPDGILCLSATNKSLLMWAHYSAAHTGFVLEFDCQSRSFKRLGRIIKVGYSTQRPAIVEDTVPLEFLGTKSPEWSYEREYRILRPFKLCERKESDTGPRYFAPFPKSCIKAVFLGYRSSAELRARVLAATAGTSIVIYRAELSTSVFDLRFVRDK